MQKAMPEPLRCCVTGNPCETDTHLLGVPCFCGNCSKFRAERIQEQETIKPEDAGEIDLFDGEG